MIDGDDAERLAIEEVFPGLVIRMCQVHLMKTVRSQARSAFGGGKVGKRKTAAFLESFRRCQRCPVANEWDRHYERLKHDTDEIAMDGGEARNKLTEYLDKEWFGERWRLYCVDFGIPAHITRDGPWSTNNYAEAAFRTLDRVFLSRRVNKR